MSNYAKISSRDNKYIKKVVKLQSSSKERNITNMYVIEGLRICEDAFDNNTDFEWILVSEKFLSDNFEISNKFFEVSKRNFVISDILFEKISDTMSPQGIIAVVNKNRLKDEISSGKKYIALDNLQDSSNLGAIARTCEALGISGIILANNCCDPYSPKSLRASMGTLLRIPLYFTDDLPNLLKTNMLKSIAFVVDKSAMPITDIDFSNIDVIIIGNEANGVSEYVKNSANTLATIPMSGKAESLNAAAAAAIAIYEFTK